MFRRAKRGSSARAAANRVCWVNLRNASAHMKATTERSPFASRFGPAPRLPPSVLRLLECTVLVITVMVVIMLLSLLLLLLLCCCLLRTLVSSRLFPFLVVHLRLSHVSFSLCTRKSSFFVSRLASCTPAPCPSSSLDLSSLFGAESHPEQIFSPTLPHPREIYARPARDRSKVDQSIASVASVHLDPPRIAVTLEIGMRGRTIDISRARPWRRGTLFTPEQSEE